MTAPLIVDPNQVNDAAAQWVKLRELFDKPAPNISGSGPESLAAQQAIAAAQAATDKLKSDIGQTAGTAQAGAGAYTQQEVKSGGSLKDATGPASDIAGMFGTASGAVVPFATETASLGGQMFSTVTSAALQVVQQVTNAAKGTTIPSSAGPGAGIGLPPADQDQHHDDGVQHD